MTVKTHWLIASMAALVALAAQAWGAAVPPRVQRLDDGSAPAFSVTNGALETVRQDGRLVYRWKPQPGKTSRLSLKPDQPAFGRLRYYDLFRFQFNVAHGQPSRIDVEALGNVSGPRQYKVHSFTVGLGSTKPGVWHRKQLTLARPFWFPWDVKEGRGKHNFLRFSTIAADPGTVIEVRRPVLTRFNLYLKPDYLRPVTWPRMTRGDNGDAEYDLAYHLVNISGRPATVHAKVVSDHKRFAVELKQSSQRAVNGEKLTFHLTATMDRGAIAATPELYSEPLRVVFYTDREPKAKTDWTGRLVRPLSKSVNRQVVVNHRFVDAMRRAAAQRHSDFAKRIDLSKTLKEADKFLKARLLVLPDDRGHVNNGYPGDWRPADRMPEAEKKSTGKRSLATRIADETWSEHLGYAGKVPRRLGVAWLLTKDPKYARKGIQLLQVFADQYARLQWNRTMFSVPWFHGPTIQTSSRLMDNSSYGSNWQLQWLCEMASLIADSNAWSDSQRRAVYRDFVVPYAAELMKMHPPNSNQSDISAHNLVLLGLAFRDPLMVWRGSVGDIGAFTRLKGIDADGFSSEGRPINYHYAGMNTYTQTLSYLDNAALHMDWPKDRLLKAARMPFERATLWGAVPNAGDCGRWRYVSGHSAPGAMVGLFPDQAWLSDAAKPSGLGSQWVAMHHAPGQGGKDAWRKLIPSKPTLFPHAGFAILRRGQTPRGQVMVTLDYGRSVFHAHDDRNQITLSAFGKIFTHGTGSLYNAGHGGMKRQHDENLESFLNGDSLGQNVVVVDQSNQVPAVGQLLAYSDQPNMQAAVSRVSGIAPGVSHTRGVALSHDIVLLFDRLKSEAAHTYDFTYHNFGQLAPTGDWHTQPHPKPLARGANYDHLENLRTLRGQGLLTLRWDLSGQVPYYKKDASTKQPIGLRLWQLPLAGKSEAYLAVTGMNNPNTKTVPGKAPTLIRRVRGQTVTFVTVLEPYQGASRVARVQPAGEHGVAVTLKDGTRIETSLNKLIRLGD